MLRVAAETAEIKQIQLDLASLIDNKQEYAHHNYKELFLFGVECLHSKIVAIYFKYLYLLKKFSNIFCEKNFYYWQNKLLKMRSNLLLKNLNNYLT